MAGRKLEKLQFYFFRDIHFQKEYHKQCALKSDLQKRALGQAMCISEKLNNPRL